MFRRFAPLAAGLALSLLVSSTAIAEAAMLNVSYDPTREFYRDFNKAFEAQWTKDGHQATEIRMSHGGSGAQARAVIDGLNADVVTLALQADIDAIAKKTGKIPADWRGQLPDNNCPYTSTIVFLVRKGNPKHIKDWDDLTKGDVQVITPNPKTSGGARWNFLAAWAYAQRKYPGDDGKVKAFMTKLYQHVPVLDTGARGSTNTFVHRGIGDVLIAWENEAYLALQKLGPGEFEIVTPSISIKAEPPVALVPGNADKDGNAEVAKAYLNYLYSPVAQKLAAKHFFRPFHPDDADPEDMTRFKTLDLVTIDDFGGWAKAQPHFFGEGGVFDTIYKPQQ
ncbi:sulfate ABC transporter substrate-binding protein [Jiella sp. MQZ9-1]|uniref:Sulfate ABC transporter substrate-binding protein n=1 Tax=Jiella flava TaxID=2816857 RepID=A0A939FUR6_9HYPH|nr:sulfate ABC transporter substrate-binding protein [Jiella flava]MBO0662318.1 sulfate ABC transporter substrate-binding protein [Jiella flava]MCD2470852.1 sulfate ABC transporter substrate-binding protein [Jiella flava]